MKKREKKICDGGVEAAPGTKTAPGQENHASGRVGGLTAYDHAMAVVDHQSCPEPVLLKNARYTNNNEPFHE